MTHIVDAADLLLTTFEKLRTLENLNVISASEKHEIQRTMRAEFREGLGLPPEPTDG